MKILQQPVLKLTKTNNIKIQNGIWTLERPALSVERASLSESMPEPICFPIRKSYPPSNKKYEN